MKNRVYYLREIHGNKGRIVIGVRKSLISGLAYVAFSPGYVVIVNMKFLTYIGKL